MHFKKALPFDGKDELNAEPKFALETKSQGAQALEIL
jgi:hypothetical protein